MKKNKRQIVAAMLAVLAVVAAGCGTDDGGSTVADDDTAASGDDGAITVQIDGKNDDFKASYFAYFPDKVTVHPGDTIVYESQFSGEPHSIAFGSVVTDVVTEFRKLPPEALESEGPPPAALDAAFAKVPPMLPEGPGDATQSSVNPCFVAAGGTPPTDPKERCEVTEPPPFTGTEVFYNSGFLADGEKFELKLADDIAPGTYVGFCTLHFVEMTSDITVVAEDVDVPSAEEVAEEAQKQLDAKTSALAPVYEEQKDGSGEGVAAGAEAEDVRGALVTEFLPKEFDAKVSDPVKFTIAGPHTVTFNASEELRVILNKDDAGAYHLNEESVSPAGFDAPPPPEGEGDGPPPAVDAGKWDGTGLLSSGIMFGGDFLVTFSKPGTYEYVCLIHPEMEGSISVS